LRGQRAGFDVILQSAVDDALTTLGESVKQAIYFHIENKFNVPKNNVSENIENFRVGLERIFGEGARFIEILIMKNLHSKIGLALEIEDDQLDFVKYINAAEESYDKTVTVSLAEEISLPIE
jgi:hypothetical protein